MAAGLRPRTQESRNRKRARLLKRRKQMLQRRIIIFIILVITFVIGAVIVKKYSPSKEKADLTEYYGITQEHQLAVVIDNNIVEAGGRIYEKRPYIEYSVIRDHLNHRFYVDINENILLYTLADGSVRAEVGASDYTYQKETHDRDYVILKMEGSKAYIALDFVKEYTNMEFRTYENPGRIVIESDWGERPVATVRKDVKLREEANVKGAILTTLSKKDKVSIIEKEEKWTKVRTEDGFVGYIKKGRLKNEAIEIFDRAFNPQRYPNISKDYTINMGWHEVEERTVNDTVLKTIADTKGLTTISPTWLSVADTQGNIKSLASSQYMNYVHHLDLEVWVRVTDFEGGINSAEESYELLSHTSKRENLVNQLMSESFKYNMDGINVEFKNISPECGEHYVQFIRELSVKCRQNGIVLSVNSSVPTKENKHYNLKELGTVVDYVFIKNYDEFEKESGQSGPTASLKYVESGIENALKYVQNEKLINAVPFFTRLWKEKVEGDNIVEVTSKLCRMNALAEIIEDADGQVRFDTELKQNYAEWKVKDTTYKIWLEDETALEGKLQLMKKHKLAGTAGWRLGYESSSAWDVIMKYVN